MDQTSVVTLVTSTQLDGSSYALTVSGIESLLGTPMQSESTSYTVTTSPLDLDGSLWIPYLEWELPDSSWSGNPFDVIASVTFLHTATGAIHTTEMFYAGSNSWKFRFAGTQIGEWTFTTTSADADLSGHAGTIVISPNSSPEARGFVSNEGSAWVWSGSGEVFVPQLAMYTTPDVYFENPDLVDNGIDNFMVEHGFNGLHIPGSCRWFDIDEQVSDNIEVPDPDPRTLEALEMLIDKVYRAGGMVHLWAWGDDEYRRWTPMRWGLNGSEDQRLQRYIAARLGPLPGWTMGYGFDLDEWTTPVARSTWVAFMNAHLGWPHLLGARPLGPNSGSDHEQFVDWNTPMDYSSYEHHRPSYETYVDALNTIPDKPVFSEDRFRLSPHAPEKDYTMEQTRRGLWHSTLVGGVANIWGVEPLYPEVSDGDIPSLTYPNPEFIQTYSTFFRKRIDKGLSRCNDLTDGYGLCYADNERFVFYKEDTNSIQLNLTGMSSPKPAVAVDTAGFYEEIDLGVLSPDNHTWLAPEGLVSDWAIAIGDFGETQPDATPPTVPQSLDGTALSDTEIMLNWQAAIDARSDVDHYVVYRDGVQIATTESVSFTDINLSGATTYTYAVTAINFVELESSLSEEITLTTDTPD